jgi:HEAT repeat protein
MLSDSSEFIRRLHEAPVLDLTRMRTRLSGWCLGEAVQVKQEQVRQQVAEDLLRIRSRWSITKAAALQPEVVTYLIRWSKGEEWYPSAIISSVRGASAAGQIALMAELAHMLENPRIELIAGALKALPSLPPSVVKANVDTIVPSLLRHKNPEVRRLALYATGILDKSIVAKTAIKILSDEKTWDLLSLQLCRYLGKELANDERLVRLLNELSTQPSPDWRLREEIARIFSYIYPRASEAFVQLFFALLSDSDHDVRREANRSLAAILRVKPSDVVLVNTVSPLKHQDPPVRRAAAVALGELDRDALVRHQIVGQLAQLFADKEQSVRMAATAALQKLSQNNLASEITSICITALENPEKSSCAIRMLSHLKTLDATGKFEQYLLRGLVSRNVHVRREATAAAGELGKERAQQHFISKLLELAQDRDKQVRAHAIVSLASLQSDDPTAQLLSIVEAGLNDRNDYVITAACRAAGLLRIRGADFVGKLLEILRRKPPRFVLGPRVLTFSRLRYWPYFFSDSSEGDEFEQQNYWKAAAATLSTIKLPNPELVISELGAMSVEMASGRQLIVPYLVGAIASIGSRHASMAALLVIFDIAKQLGEPHQRGYPIELMTHEAIFMSPAYMWQAQRPDFGDEALLVAKTLPPREVIRLFRTVLEGNSYGARLLVLQIVGALNANVTSELYPSVMKHLTDEEEQIRTAAWKVAQTLSVNRGLWETDPSLHQQENSEMVSIARG